MNASAQAGVESRVIYEFASLQRLDQWWHWIVLLAVILSIISYVVFWYRKDWVELPKSLGLALLFLRLTALIGIFVFFFDIQKRAEQRITRNSRVAVLVDTSLSMSLASEQDSPDSRIASVVRNLTETPVIADLMERHDVTVYRFDQLSRPTPVASFEKPSSQDVASASGRVQLESVWRWTSNVAWLGSIVGVVSLLMLAVFLGGRLSGIINDSWAYLSLVGVVGSIISVVLISVSVLRATDLPWQSLWASRYDAGWATTAVDPTAVKQTEVKQPQAMNWADLLTANGSESRIGDAMKSLLELERGAPLAGVVLVTDGQNNAGVDPAAAISEAALSNIAFYPIGLGSDQDPANIRVVDVDAPKRVYPGDRFRLSALLQATGQKEAKATVQLRSSAKGGNASDLTIEEETQVTLSSDGQLLPVQFDVEPRKVGDWVYEIKLLPSGTDTNALDNAMDTLVRVVDANSKVLVIAGGPTREYQFVRNLLYRDQTVESHVLLQTGKPGLSQEADKLLDEFPRTLVEMSEYDCVIAFDADWMSLDTSQVEALERWVSEQAGGLVIIAGPVATPRWTGTEGNGDRRAELLRGLAPVVLNSRGTRMINMGRFEGETAWPLKFTPDGTRTDFLMVSDTPEASQSVWESFPGVYSFYACYDPKPGALPLAYFSDPSATFDGEFPIFLASHFYGAGRVVFQGSGEFWRLRQFGESNFDTYYTKLARWVGQGRLLRDSDRGMLLLDKEEALVGEQIVVRAVLRDSQFQPLIEPSVEAKLVDPQQRRTPLTLAPVQDPTQPGVYVGTFFAKQTGTYTVELTIGGLADNELLSQQTTVRVPAREVQRGQRNDSLLSEIANKTKGKYYIGMDRAAKSSNNEPAPLVQEIVPQDQVNYLPGAPDREFQQRLMTMLMALIGGALSLEWLIRRLSRLA